MEYLHRELAGDSAFDETQKRFENLRSYGCLPRGRNSAQQRLSDEEIASAVMGFVPVRPGWAGQVSGCLADLKPVGGPAASFGSANSLVVAIAKLIADDEACRSIVTVTLSIETDDFNDEYYSKILYEVDGRRRTASYVSKLAYSLLRDGAENSFDSERPNVPRAHHLVLGRSFFQKMFRSVAISRKLDLPLKTDWREYTSEEERAGFYRRLGARNGSRYLNIGVDTQVTWPKEPTTVLFDGRQIVLFPKTKETSHSMSIDLVHGQLTMDDARTLLNRFLSILAWCDDRHAILREGWAGNPVPVPVSRRDMAFVTSSPWIFHRSLPTSPELLQRLAYYREALNAREASIISLSVLSFFKVFEVRQRSKAGEKNPTKVWISTAFPDATRRVPKGFLEKFLEACAHERVEDYIFENYRVATAHTSAKVPSDADSSEETHRLYLGAEVIQALARYFLLTEFKFSEFYYSD